LEARARGHEAHPGRAERGVPTEGARFQALRYGLAEAGLKGRAYLVNTVFWRPPGGRPPSPAEQAACAPFIDRALALLKPQAVLIPGAPAARPVLGRAENIMRLTGPWPVGGA